MRVCCSLCWRTVLLHYPRYYYCTSTSKSSRWRWKEKNPPPFGINNFIGERLSLSLHFRRVASSDVAGVQDVAALFNKFIIIAFNAINSGRQQILWIPEIKKGPTRTAFSRNAAQHGYRVTRLIIKRLPPSSSPFLGENTRQEIISA